MPIIFRAAHFYCVAVVGQKHKRIPPLTLLSSGGGGGGVWSAPLPQRVTQALGGSSFFFDPPSLQRKHTGLIPEPRKQLSRTRMPLRSYRVYVEKNDPQPPVQRSAPLRAVERWSSSAARVCCRARKFWPAGRCHRPASRPSSKGLVTSFDLSIPAAPCEGALRQR